MLESPADDFQSAGLCCFMLALFAYLIGSLPPPPVTAPLAYSGARRRIAASINLLCAKSQAITRPL